MIHSNKFIYFLIGLIVGAAIGASVVWWMQNYDFKIWFTFSGKNKHEIITKDDNASDNLNDDNSKTNSNVPKSIVVKKDANYSSEDDSTLMVGQNNEYVADTSDEPRNSLSEEIVIAKDELLFTKIIKIEGMNIGNAKKDATLDSLLINDKTKKLPVNYVKVEFWRSPINYKGYKFNNNKLVLFGIYRYDDTTLESRNNKIYLNYANTFYLIEKVDDFQPLMSVKLPKNK